MPRAFLASVLLLGCLVAARPGRAAEADAGPSIADACARELPALRTEREALARELERLRALHEREPSSAIESEIVALVTRDVELLGRAAHLESRCASLPTGAAPVPAAPLEPAPGSESSRHFDCLDTPGLTAWEARLNRAQRQQVEASAAGQPGFAVRLYRTRLRDAAAGDTDARYRIGSHWTQCQLLYGDLPAAQLARTLEYLRTGDGDSPRTRAGLGLFHSLGWGVPVDSAQAAQLYAQHPAAQPIEAFVAEHGLANATPEAQGAAYAYRETIERLAPFRLGALWNELMRGKRGQPDAVALAFSVQACPLQPGALTAAGLDAEAHALLAATLARLAAAASAGPLPCTTEAGTPLELRFELELYAPGVDPLRA